MEITLQLKSDSSKFGQFSPNEAVVPQLHVVPTTPHPVDRLLPESHLQRMKQVLAIANVCRPQKANRRQADQ